MNSNRIAVALTVLLLAVAPNLHAACSNASLHGAYGYSSQGFTEVTADVSPALFVPWTTIGLIAFDGKGIVTSGTFTVNTTTAAGGVIRGTFTGTYTVNSNCAGTSELLLDDGVTIVHYDLVVLSPAQFVSTETDAGGVISIYSAQKVAGKDQHAGTR
jgi:hypothetical protein